MDEMSVKRRRDRKDPHGSRAPMGAPIFLKGTLAQNLA